MRRNHMGKVENKSDFCEISKCIPTSGAKLTEIVNEANELLNNAVIFNKDSIRRSQFDAGANRIQYNTN